MILAGVQFFGYDYLKGKMCIRWKKVWVVKIPIPAWCQPHQWVLVDISGPTFNLLLFKIQTGPYDVTVSAATSERTCHGNCKPPSFAESDLLCVARAAGIIMLPALLKAYFTCDCSLLRRESSLSLRQTKIASSLPRRALVSLNHRPGPRPSVSLD